MTRRLLMVSLVMLSVSSGPPGVAADERGTRLVSPYTATFTKPLRTIDQVLTLTSFEGDKRGTWRGRIVVDFERRSFAAITLERKKETDEPEEGLIVVGDKTYKVRYKRKEPDVKEAPSRLDSVARIVRQASFRQFMAIAVSSARFDGPVKYGDVLQGDQVTTVSTDGRKAEVRLVFDPGGRLLGKVVDAPEAGKRQLQVTRLAEAAGPGDYAKLVNARIYLYDEEKSQATLVAERRVDRIVVNQPVDPAVFKVTLKKKDGSARPAVPERR
jgi:hypothetical protein